MKITQIAHAQVLGSVEDGRPIRSLSFLKIKLGNRPTTHLDLVIHIYAQDFYTLNTLPHQVSISDWKAQRVHYRWKE